MTARKIILGASALLITAAGALLAWATICPCGPLPGFMLLGDVQVAPVTDWRFVNDVPRCQIQVDAGLIPHSVNLNCMATSEGELYLGCFTCSTKYWANHMGPSARGRLRLNGRVYLVVLTRVLDEAVLDRVWAARVKKLQARGGRPGNPADQLDPRRPPGWWGFRAHSATD